MIDLIVDSFIEGFEEEMGKESALYSDLLIDSISARGLNTQDPTGSMAVIEEKSYPDQYSIGQTIGPTREAYPIQVQIMTRSIKQVDGRANRRVLVRRAKLALFRPSGYIRDSVIGLTDTEDGYDDFKETVLEFKYKDVLYDFLLGEDNHFSFLAAINLIVTTEVYYG